MSRGPVVYFVQAGEDGHIKIGFSEHLANRLATLRTHVPGTLRIRLCLPGTLADERALHERFAAARGNGEWFQPVPELRQFIDEASIRGKLFPGMSEVVRLEGGETLHALAAAVDAYKRRTVTTDEVIAKNAGIRRETLVRAMTKAREGSGTVDLETAEKIAKAIGWRLRLEPDHETPPEE